ncbi:D-aminoacyl-tRNA deacylase [soil metagenome]
MRTVVQRVSEASVTINGTVKSAIGAGLLVLVGFETTDTADDVDWMVKKLTQLRIFADEQGLMNRSVLDIDGEILAISQFTLHASTKKGNRPSFIQSARPDVAISLYEAFLSKLAANLGKAIGSGEFGADMKVALVNDGPVTITMDSKNKE